MSYPSQMPAPNATDLARQMRAGGVAPMDQIAHQQQLAIALSGGGSRGSSAPVPPPSPPGFFENMANGARIVGGGIADAGRWAADKLTAPSAQASMAPPAPPPAPPTSEDVNQSNQQLASIVEAYNRGDATKQQVAAALTALDRGWQRRFGEPHPNAGWVADEFPNDPPARAPLNVSIGKVEMPPSLTIGAPRAGGPGNVPVGPAPEPMTVLERQNAAAALSASREMRRRSENPKSRVMSPSGSKMPKNRQLPEG